MLVLTRRIKESIVICLPDGTEVEVYVVAVSNGKARLGVDAPQSVRITRNEVDDR